MSDQASKPPFGEPPYGLRPETWAVAEYDAIREAINSLLAETIAGIDCCEAWLSDHDVVVGAGGNKMPALFDWVQKKHRELEGLDAQLLRLRRSPMDIRTRAKEFEALIPVVRRAVAEQWPRHLDGAQAGSQSAPKIPVPLGTDRG